MNKSYRTIWNQSLGAWVAASELASARGKSGRSRKAVLAGAVALALGGALSPAHADTDLGGGTTPSTLGGNIAIGGSAAAPTCTNPTASGGAASAIAIGCGTTVSAREAIAIGTLANASAESAVALGTQANASANYSTALGNRSVASQIGASAMGSGANATGIQSTAVGNDAFATAQAASAFGYAARAAGTSSTAIGTQARALNANDVALGSSSVTAATVATPSATINGTSYTFAGPAPTSTVSVGAVGSERTITNVAAGRINGSSTDAINGSQLYAVQQAVEAGQTHYYSVNDNGVNGANYNNNGATGVNALAAGVGASAAGQSGTAVGNAANAIGANSTALGAGAIAIQAGDVALGSGSVTAPVVPTTSATIAGTTYTFAGVAPTSTVSVGNVGSERTITNVAAGRLNASSTDAVNGSQLYATNQAITNVSGKLTHYYSVNDNGVQGGNYNNDGATGVNSLAAGVGATAQGTSSVAVGNGASASLADAIAIGHNAQAVDGVALGSKANAYGTATTAIGANSVAQGGNATALGDKAQALGDNSLAAGKDSVASGQQSTALGQAASATGLDSTAVGVNSRATQTSSTALGAGSLAAGVQSVAVGQNSAANNVGSIAVGSNTVSNGFQGVALGNNAQAQAGNSVALGAGSVASTAAGAVGYDPATGLPSTNTSPTWVSTMGAVSVGDAAGGLTRQITGVAAGTQATDAVNVAQLQAAQAAATTHYYSVNDNGVQGANYNNDGATGINALAAGVGASATGTGATAIGASARALSGGDTAIGTGSLASGGASVAVGNLASASGSESLAFGSGTIAAGAGSMALGTTSSASGDQSIALGSFAAAWQDKAVAIGADAVANNANDVALGSNSVTAAAVGTTSTTINGVTYNFAGTTPTSTVSVGSVGAERTITNVAAGRISGTSTDAINGSQLYATNQAIKNVVDGGTGIKYFHANSTDPDSQANGQNSVAVGPNAVADGTQSVAMGDGAKATVANGVALGSYAVANRAAGTAGYDPATGLASTNTSSTWQSTLGAFSVGDAASNRTRQITGVAAGTADTDAVNVAQLQALRSSVNTSIDIAANKWVTGSQTSTYVAPSATGVESTAVGSGSVASAANSVAVGTGAAATTANSVALGNGSTTGNATGVSGTTINGTSYSFAGSNPTGVVSVGSAGNERQIQNVAAGQLSATSTDAVNGSQLYATNQAISQIAATAGAGINVTTAATGSGIAVGTSVANVGPGGTATYTAGNNVVLKQNGTNLTFAVNDNPNFTSVTVGKTSVTNNGVSIQGGPSMTTSGIDAGGKTITNVAPGVNGTDAANVNQVNQAGAANRAYTDYRASQLNDRIDGVAKNAYAGVAAAMAVQMPGSYVPGKTVMRIGYGVFKGESAVGVSFRRTSENNAWSLTGGVGLSRAGTAATVGAEWVFN